MLLPQHDPPAHKHLLCNLVLGHAGEYFRANRALAPFSHALTSFDTTPTLTTLHFKSNGYISHFFKDYELDQNLELSSNSFKLAFQRMPHLSTNGHLGWFLNTFGPFSFKKIRKWIPLVILALLSYC
jgi:hypothetical protein